MMTLRGAGGREVYVEQDETVLTVTTTLVVSRVMMTLSGGRDGSREGGREGRRCYVQQDETVLTLTTTLVVPRLVVACAR